MTEAACHPEPGAVRPLVGLLRQLDDLVAALTDEQYTRAPVGAVESSVGAHVRHNLDHVAALLRGLTTGTLNYDHRDRGTAVERDRGAARAEILRLEGELLAFPWAQVPSNIVLTALVEPDQPPVLARTSAERELAFVVSHTIHHNALVRVMAKLLGAAVPADFGYAPSTVIDTRRRACVR